jgi:hypothetical protein
MINQYCNNYNEKCFFLNSCSLVSFFLSFELIFLHFFFSDSSNLILIRLCSSCVRAHKKSDKTCVCVVRFVVSLIDFYDTFVFCWSSVCAAHTSALSLDRCHFFPSFLPSFPYHVFFSFRSNATSLL